MKTRHAFRLVVAAFFLVTTALNGQSTLFRSGIFLHHSTGGCIWGPNGGTVSVPQQMAIYNTAHGYTGSNAVSMNETWFPNYTDNEWVTWHTIFEQNSPENISSYFATNPVIMIKSCYPASSVYSWGSPDDTLNPSQKSVENYKWHWRHIVEVMRNHPDNFFVVWTNAPLVQGATSPTEAMLSHKFCKWAKDTLAQGLDPQCGSFPDNIYVFDIFHKLVNAQYYLPLQYAANSGDSHPNAAATTLIAPQLVTEVFDHAIAYENLIGLKDISGTLTYQNTASTPLSGVKLVLKLGCCTLIDSTITNSNGSFSFANLQPGNYTITASKTGNWGGSNSDDALHTLKAFVNMVSLNTLQHKAGDVDMNDNINAVDALLIAKRFVGLIGSFSIPDWSFENPVVSLTGSVNLNVMIKGLCSGDVNCSYIP
jgi:hypothetical protein